MHEFIVRLFFFNASQAFGKDVQTTKTQLIEIGQKFEKDKNFTLRQYSEKIREVIMFYLENKDYLQC